MGHLPRYSNPSLIQKGIVQVLHVVCCHMDSSQLADIVGSMIREGNSLFRKDNVCNIVTASMDWSTTAQLLLWQLSEPSSFYRILITPSSSFRRSSDGLASSYSSQDTIRPTRGDCCQSIAHSKEARPRAGDESPEDDPLPTTIEGRLLYHQLLQSRTFYRAEIGLLDPDRRGGHVYEGGRPDSPVDQETH